MKACLMTQHNCLEKFKCSLVDIYILKATGYAAEEIVTRKISREEPDSPPDMIITNSGNNGGSASNTLTRSSPLWKQSLDQQQQQQQSQHQNLLPSTTSKLDPKAPSSIHEHLSQNNYQSPQREKESEVQGLFPETRTALSLSSPKIVYSTFAPPSDLKLKKDLPSYIKPMISFAEGKNAFSYG